MATTVYLLHDHILVSITILRIKCVFWDAVFPVAVESQSKVDIHM